MGIRDEDIARVRATTDIVALVSEYVQLRQVGQRWRGLCPFHTERTPSFYVNAIDGLFHCFGCQTSGDAITFVREIEHLGFVDAVERLASKVGVTLEYDEPGQGRVRHERRRLAEVLATAEAWYHERLLSSPDAAAARKYLRDRGFDGDEVRRWRIGWAPDDWDQLVSDLRLSKKDLAATGLGFINRRNRPQDFFRGRVLFPIHDPDGTTVGFGGRILPGIDGPKYINTTQTPLYDKSRVLFALDVAKAGIVEADEVVVCEGYTDVTACFRAGVERAVATCGTALTDDHVKQLRKFARRIVLAFDADSAGQAAAERFYQWEERYDLDVVVAALPAGVDPAELAGQDPDALATAIAEARSFLEFRLNRALDAHDLDSAEHRARAAEEALAVIAEHPNDLVRDQYLMQVADRCRVDVERLRQRVRSGEIRRPTSSTRGDRNDRSRGRAGEGANQRRGQDEPPRGDPGDDLDPYGDADGADRADRAPDGPPPVRLSAEDLESPATEVLRLAVNAPASVVDWLHPVLFERRLHRDAYDALVGASTIHDAIETAAPDVAAFLSRLAVEEPVDDALDPMVLLVRSVGARELAVRRAIPDPDLDTLAKMAAMATLVGALGQGGSAREREAREAQARELLRLLITEGDNR